jgi:hypothetical protein
MLVGLRPAMSRSLPSLLGHTVIHQRLGPIRLARIPMLVRLPAVRLDIAQAGVRRSLVQARSRVVHVGARPDGCRRSLSRLNRQPLGLLGKLTGAVGLRDSRTLRIGVRRPPRQLLATKFRQTIRRLRGPFPRLTGAIVRFLRPALMSQTCRLLT